MSTIIKNCHMSQIFQLLKTKMVILLLLATYCYMTKKTNLFLNLRVTLLRCFFSTLKQARLCKRSKREKRRLNSTNCAMRPKTGRRTCQEPSSASRLKGCIRSIPELLTTVSYSPNSTRLMYCLTRLVPILMGGSLLDRQMVISDCTSRWVR